MRDPRKDYPLLPMISPLGGVNPLMLQMLMQQQGAGGMPPGGPQLPMPAARQGAMAPTGPIMPPAGPQPPGPNGLLGGAGGMNPLQMMMLAKGINGMIPPAANGLPAAQGAVGPGGQGFNPILQNSPIGGGSIPWQGSAASSPGLWSWLQGLFGGAGGG